MTLRKEIYRQEDIDKLCKGLLLCCQGSLALSESQSYTIDLTICTDDNGDMYHSNLLPSCVLYKDVNLFFDVENNLSEDYWNLIKDNFTALQLIEYTTNEEIKILQVLAERGFWLSYQTIAFEAWLAWAIAVLERIKDYTAYELSQQLTGWTKK